MSEKRLTVWHAPASLDWLQAVLWERFGHVFNLRMQDMRTLWLMHGADRRRIELTVDGATFNRADSALPCTQWDAAVEGWHTALCPRLPAPGAAQLPAQLVTPTNTGFRIQYDIFGLTYWMLTRQEEIGRTDLDEHGRFPATSSHAFKHGYLERPIVDEWLHILGQVITQTWPGLSLKKPDFSIKVSHDVDTPSRYWFRSIKGLVRAMGGDIIKRGHFKNALLGLWMRLHTRTMLHPADPYNTFNWLMDLSDRHGLRSAFYFICGNTASHDDYELEHPVIRHLMRHIHARGHEIGLHPSFGTHQRSDLIAAQARRLRRIVEEEGITQSEWGGRMHYLLWEQPTTLRAWAQAGMTYDSSLGYADRVGFRCGTCFEYPAFDPVASQVLPLRVRPLVAMESTVIDQKFMGLGMGAAARDKFLHLKATCRAVGGCFTFLWHNSHFENNAERQIYEEVLGEAQTM